MRDESAVYAWCRISSDYEDFNNIVTAEPPNEAVIFISSIKENERKWLFQNQTNRKLHKRLKKASVGKRIIYG